MRTRPITEVEKLEKRIFSVEKAVRLTTSSDAPAASGPDRATSSTVVSFRDLTARVDRLQGESDRHAEWATGAIDELPAEYRSFADRMLESRGDRGSIVESIAKLGIMILSSRTLGP